MHGWLHRVIDKRIPFIKKGILVVLGVLFVLFCGLLVVLVRLAVTCRDKTILEHVIDESHTIRIRTTGCWKGYVPVYLETDGKEGITLQSAPFSSYSSKELVSERFGIEIHKIDTIVFVHYENMPDWILAMVDLENDLVYPRIGGDDHDEIKFYYSRVEHLFSRLKILLKNDELELRR